MSAQQPEYNQQRALDLVMQLMAIPGKAGDERKIADAIVAHLRDAGGEDIVEDDPPIDTPVEGNAGNLIFRLPGTIDAPRRLLTAHIDTVPICVGCEPVLQGAMVRSANPKTGLGADDRAGAAVLLNTALTILENELPHPPLTFCWFVQEEIGLHGARNVKLPMLAAPELAFNWDGGNPAKLTIGATGGYRMKIDVHGVASHAGGAPEWGVSAIAISALAIADLTRGGWHGAIEKDGRLGTSNVGFVHGGEATNVVTDFVTLKAEARSHNAEFRKEIVTKIEAAFQSAAEEVKNVAGANGKVEISGRLDYESFRIEENAPTVQAAKRAVEQAGHQAETAIANGGLDANWLTAHGVPSVTLGCGQIGQHMVTETLDVEQFQAACQIALILACGAENHA